MTHYVFFKRFPDGTVFRFGTAVHYPEGWRFLPTVSGRTGSRKFHPTMEKCLPRWIGYPDRCESAVYEPPK